jgi:hypothetical protein
MIKNTTGKGEEIAKKITVQKGDVNDQGLSPF